MQKTTLLILFLLILSISSARAEVDNQTGIWPQLMLKIKLNEKSQLNLGSSPRVNDNYRQFDQHLWISDYIYHFSEHWSGLLGYRWLTTYPDDFGQQHWLDQGIIFNHKLRVNESKVISFKHRAMIEERFMNNIDVYSTRFRYLLSARMPLTKSQKLSLLSFNELFINLNETETGPEQGVDRNRFFFGLDYMFNKNMNLEAGYQLETVNLLDNRYRLEHLLVTNLVFNISL